MIETDRSTPLLFLVFNRPKQTKITFQAVREYQPKQLYVACDGPRSSREGEEALCREVRQIATQVDWDCEVKTLFRDENLGCEVAVSSAISWFFSQVERGIILEDDCVPDPSFFTYCAEMLERFRDDARIGCITGNNFQFGRKYGTASYYFSKYFHCWGWGTWKRSWDLFRLELPPGDGNQREMVFDGFPFSESEKRWWRRLFGRLQRREFNTWDYRWQYWLFLHRMLVVTPQFNLVRNIGFGADATHTRESAKNWGENSSSLRFPLVHPTQVTQSLAADHRIASRLLGLGPWNRIKGLLSQGVSGYRSLRSLVTREKVPNNLSGNR
jgi:hypothetical protein